MRKALVTLGASILIVLALSGCGGKSAVATAGSTSPPVPSTTSSPRAALPSAPAAPGSSPSAPALAAPGSSAVRDHVSTLPDGVFRSHIDYSLITKRGGDPGMVGTWTLTVKDGTFRLDCDPISTPDTDCGNNGVQKIDTVEMGTLRGTGSTVRFVEDNAAKSKLMGCVVHSIDIGGCGPDGGYQARWALNGQSLVFTDYVGLGDEDGDPALSTQTIQPWTRIS